MKIAILLAALIGLAACSDTADMFPMNAAAQRLGPVKASFVRTGIGRGPVTVTMANGEVLTGEYRVAFGSSVGTAFLERDRLLLSLLAMGPSNLL